MSADDPPPEGEPFRPPPPRPWLLVIGVAFEGGIGLAAWALGRLFGLDPLSSFTWSRHDAGAGLLAIFPLIGLLAVCMRSSWRPLARIREFLETVVRPLLADWTSPELALLALAAGFGEEALFRGLIQNSLAHAVGLWPAVILASLVFGLAHPITPAYIILAGVMGAYLGAVYIATGNLLVPMVAHAAYDFVALVWLLARSDRESSAHL